MGWDRKKNSIMSIIFDWDYLYYFEFKPVICTFCKLKVLGSEILRNSTLSNFTLRHHKKKQKHCKLYALKSFYA